ncbi:ABC transporter permease [Spirosoma sp. SC4-14]|uniref:ABC transporter permease n=1 Tax=Spirosoma sp. SC4-14 TaxID=3128900 RepID=UPI0030D042BA
MHYKPPYFATWLLETFGHPDTSEEVQGDLLELYVHWVQTVGKRKADWRYSWSVFKLLRPLAQSKTAKEYPSPFSLGPAMIRNYLKIAWRNLAHARVFSLINGFGLTVGIACALLVFLVIRHQTSYDRNHKNGDRVYRVQTVNNSDPNPHPGTYTEMATVLRSEAPELETVVPIMNKWGKGLAIPESGAFFKERVVFTDPGLFHLLDYQWLTGNARTALARPDQVVLTESYARKFFGTTDVVGKTIRYDNKEDLRVTGILKDHPETTNFPFDILISYPTLKRVEPDFDSHGWSGFGDDFQVYALLKPGFKPEQLTRRFHAIQVKYQKDPKMVENQHFALNPLSELHYSFNFSGRQANKKMLNTLALIGLFVLFIACINFINLTTAQALKRAKEVGIRKAVGSNRLSLIYQFLTEAGLITWIATLMSVLLAWLVLPAVANMMGLPLAASDLFSWPIALFLGGLAIVTALLAGTYPAFRLSGMAPIWALKSNKLPRGERRVTLRQGLVVVQFTIAMVLISSALLIRQQLSFFQTANLGFNKNAIITVSLPDNKPEKLQSLRAQLMESPQIKDVSFSFNSASAESNWMQGMQYRTGATAIEVKTQMKMGDSHYLDTYGIQLLAGQGFREGDTAYFKVLTNEVFLSRIGISDPRAAIGQKIYYGDGPQFATIIGVVKDFHVNSLHQKIDPTLIQVVPNNFYQAGIKLKSEKPTAESIQSALATLEKAWKATFPDQVFAYDFLDKTLADAYKNETRTAQLIDTSTLIAILISCLGLFGLATFTAEQRTKEIGVRKVLGASVGSIVALLSRDFLKLVLVAILIAAPVAWYGVSEWLQNFEFKIQIHWWVFVLTGLSLVLIALLTVSFQSIKAALINPVKSLRSE